MNDSRFPRPDPASSRSAATTIGGGRGSEKRNPAGGAADDTRWPVAARLLFMVGAGAACWAILGFIVYLLW